MKKPTPEIVTFINLLAGGCIVGIGPILAKIIHLHPICIVLYRIMLPISILFFIKTFNQKRLALPLIKNKNHLLFMSAIGILFSLDLMTFYISLKYTNVASATLLANLSPVLIVIYSSITKRVLSKELLWVFLSLVGLMLLCHHTSHVASNALLGDSIAIISAVFFTGYILLINQLGSQYTSIDIMLWSSISASIFVLAICVIFHINLHITSYHDLFYLLLMSWGAQLIGQTMLTTAIATFPPKLSSLGILIDPVSAAMFAWILLGETLTRLELMGASLILTSIFFAYVFNSTNTISTNEEAVNG